MNALLAPPPSRATSPAAPATALVLQPLWQPTLAPRLLASCRLQIGAGADCDLRVKAPGVAERHAMVLAGPQRVVLRAWDARTWVNDLPVQETTLRAGDRVAIGPVQFRVRAATADDILTQLPASGQAPSLDDVAPPAPPSAPSPFPDAPVPQAAVETHESVFCPPPHLLGEWVSAPTGWPTFESIVESTPWIAQERLPERLEPDSAEPAAKPSPPPSIDVEALIAERLRERQAAWEAERREWEQQRADWDAQVVAQQRQLDARAQELARLGEQLNRRQERLARQQAEHATQSARLEQLQAQWREQQTELRRLRDELQSERERLEAVVTQARTELAAEAERQAAACQEWESRQQRLTSELTDQFAAVEARRAELTDRANQLEAERSAVHLARTELEAERRSFAESQADFDAERARWNAACQRADKELAELRDDLQRQQLQLLADIHRRAQAESELLAARQELQQERRRFAEQHADWLKDREAQWEHVSQRRRQLEEDCASLERQHRRMGELVAAIESELIAARKDRETLREERERLAAVQAEEAANRARGEAGRQEAEADAHAWEENLQRQFAELAAERERCAQVRRTLEDAQDRLECDREQFVRDQAAWQQQRATEQQALGVQREQLEAQLRAVEVQREAIAGLQASLQHEVTVTVLEREQLQAERERLRQERSQTANVAVSSLPTPPVDVVPERTASTVSLAVDVSEDSVAGLDALWEHQPRLPSAVPEFDRAAAAPEDAWHNTLPDWDEWAGSAFARCETAAPSEPTPCSLEASPPSAPMSSSIPRSDVAALGYRSEIPELDFADEWSAIPDRQRDVVTGPSNWRPCDTLLQHEATNPDKTIVDSVNSLRSELARLFNLPEDFADREPAAASAVEAVEESIGPTVAELVANIQDDETAYAIEVPAEPEEASLADWRARLQSLVGVSGLESSPSSPVNAIVSASEPTPAVEPAESSVPPDDSIDAYMERLLARHRRQRSECNEEPWSDRLQPSTSDYAIENPCRSAPSSATLATEPGTSTEFNPDDDSHLNAAPRHQQDKHVVRAHLQSFREVANLSARTALARHGWRVVRTEIAVHGFLTMAALAGAAGFLYAPLWQGAMHWDRSLACLIAAGWTFRRCLAAARRLRQCRSAETRISNIAVGSALRHASTATRHPKSTESVDGGDAFIPAEAAPESVPPSPVE